MEIVFISDTHDQQLTSIDVPDGDILCFTGDIHEAYGTLEYMDIL